MHWVDMLMGLNENIEKHQSTLKGKSFAHSCLKIIQLLNFNTNVAKGFSKLYKIGEGSGVMTLRIPTLVLHILPLLDHAQIIVAQTDYFDCGAVLRAGLELLNIHLNTALTGDAGHLCIGQSQLYAHSSRQTKAHCS